MRKAKRLRLVHLTEPEYARWLFDHSGVHLTHIFGEYFYAYDGGDLWSELFGEVVIYEEEMERWVAEAHKRLVLTVPSQRALNGLNRAFNKGYHPVHIVSEDVAVLTTEKDFLYHQYVQNKIRARALEFITGR